MNNKKDFISGAIKNPGALRRALKVKKGKKIPDKKLEKALHSSSPITRKRAGLAKTLRKLNRKK